MPKKKVGKQRKDKFYQLAKETGYRSRAAFKLIQLNRKFEFLQKSRVLLDLCAAPGGWMQVAKQNMPVSSIVIGVDLFPIKPISGCMSIVGDITSEQCKQAITKELQTWKADVVLHDGAPNVGQNWLYDAYQQACLTLSSFKLATEFLREGGWFVTKVFRSKDYNPLLWVLKQFFKRVHATKPQASRNESAEIFVVCQYYLAPKKIDHRFLDPKYVFKELDLEPTPIANILKPENKKKKPKAEGYSELHGVYHQVKASEFVKSEDPLETLQIASCLLFDDTEIESHSLTTPEIKECCKDIKVLGRKELKELINWAKAIKASLSLDSKDVKTESDKMSTEEATDVKEEESDEDEQELKDFDKKISQLEDEERRELKRKKKRRDKERAKLREKMNLKMIHKGDDGPVEEDAIDTMFSLRQITTHEDLDQITNNVAPSLVAREEGHSDEEPEEPGFRSKRTRFDPDKDHLDSSGLYYRSDESVHEDSGSELSFQSDKEGLGFSDEGDDKKPLKKKSVRFSEDTKQEDGGGSDEEEDETEDMDNPLITDLDPRDRETKRLQKAQLWFQKDAFNALEADEDEEFELEQLAEKVRKDGGQIIRRQPVEREEGYCSDESQDSGQESDGGGDSETETDSDKLSNGSSTDSDYDAEEYAPRPSTVKQVSNDKGDFEIVSRESAKAGGKKRKLDAEGLALGSLMIQSRKRKRDIMDDGWNRYSFNDENLPDWFVENEKQYMRKEAPVPKELVDEYNKKTEELNARPIKKVLEAKARKKKRVLKKLERAKKRIEGLMENPDVSEKEKARQVAKLYKAAKGKKPEITYIVSKKHSASKRVKRPKGVKGRFKVVDPRMKKDNRKEKTIFKKGKKGKKDGKGMGKMRIKKKSSTKAQ